MLASLLQAEMFLLAYSFNLYEITQCCLKTVVSVL